MPAQKCFMVMMLSAMLLHWCREYQIACMDHAWHHWRAILWETQACELELPASSSIVVNSRPGSLHSKAMDSRPTSQQSHRPRSTSQQIPRQTAWTKRQLGDIEPTCLLSNPMLNSEDKQRFFDAFLPWSSPSWFRCPCRLPPPRQRQGKWALRSSLPYWYGLYAGE